MVEVGDTLPPPTTLLLLIDAFSLYDVFPRPRSIGVTRRSLKVFSADLISFTTSAWLDHFTSLSPIATR